MHEGTDEGVERMGKGWVKALVLCVVILGLWGIHVMMPDRWSDPNEMAKFIGQLGIGEGLGFLLLASFLTFSGVPRLLFFALGGWLFGAGEGFALAMSASMAGSVGVFWLLRWVGRDWISARFGKRKLIAKITQIEPGVGSVFLVRQLPVGNLMVNAGLALSRVKSPIFIMGSALGFLPQGVVAALIGGGMAEDRLAPGAMQVGLALLLMGFVGMKWVCGPQKCREEEVNQ